jgi:hypothetical protein
MIKIDVIDLDKVLKFLIDLPEECADQAVEDVNDYMLNVARTYPSYRYIPFAKAYGGFFSDKQRRYVMGAIRRGEIVPGQPNRSQAYARAWHKVGEGRGQYLANSTSYGMHLQSEQQARMPAMIGWKKISDILQERLPKIEQIILAAVKKVMKKRGAR